MNWIIILLVLIVIIQCCAINEYKEKYNKLLSEHKELTELKNALDKKVKIIKSFKNLFK